MGNLFIGFPVPRAKIAEMIEGSAPPLEHKENHEPDGSDPLVLPGDISEGQILKWDGSKFIGVNEPTAGITFPWDDFIFHTYFESLDGIYNGNAGAGSVSLDPNYVLLETGGATADKAYLLKVCEYPHLTLTWDSSRKFKTRVAFELSSGVIGRYLVCIGHPITGTAIGFRVEDGLLQAFIKTQAGTETQTIEDWSSSPGWYERNLDIYHNPPAYPKFYVEGSGLGFDKRLK